MVYRDPSMMINEMTPENFNLFISKMGAPPNSILSSNYKKFLPDLWSKKLSVELKSLGINIIHDITTVIIINNIS